MRLRCTQGPIRGQLIELDTTQAVVLGREPQGAEGLPVLLESQTVSRKHCQIDFDGRSFRIKDLKSSNGIRVNRQKVIDAYLSRGDLIQVGEFSFLVEDEPQIQTETERDDRTPAVSSTYKASEAPEAAAKKAVLHVEKAKQLGRSLSSRFQRLDYLIKVAIVIALGGLISHWIVSIAMIEESRFALIQQSFDVGRQAIRNMAEKNKNSLAAESAISLDCSFIRDVPGVLSAFVLNRDGRTLCPVGANQFEDGLHLATLELQEPLNDCQAKIFSEGQESCGFMGPVFDWSESKQSPEVVGYVRLEFSPQKSFAAVQSLQSLRWKTLLFSLSILLAIWLLIRLWLRKGMASAAENIHVVTTGSSQNVEKIESFASLDPVVEEVNRMITKSNQGVIQGSRDLESEASFLQTFLQQILLLEERAVLAVDSENQLLAASSTLPQVVPIDLSLEKAHITEIVADTHLQGELMSFLNDLSSSESVQDRALSMADRVLQVRGMPLYLKNNHVATLLIF